MSEYADKYTQAALIRAVNMLGGYVAHRLPPDWEIQLQMRHRESSMTLINPDGEEVEVDTDWDISMVDAMIEVAKEADRDRLKEESTS
jgi:hypothetical protein